MAYEMRISDWSSDVCSSDLVLMPDGHDAEAVRRICMDRFNVSIGGGLGELSGRVFRIGHLGDLNEPMILGTIASVEAALKSARVPHGPGGTEAAISWLADAPSAGAPLLALMVAPTDRRPDYRPAFRSGSYGSRRPGLQHRPPPAPTR